MHLKEKVYTVKEALLIKKRTWQTPDDDLFADVYLLPD